MWFLYFLGTVVLLFVIARIRIVVLFRKKETCSICSRQAGEKNNKRYSLADGCMCELCANEYGYISATTNGPNAFANTSVSEVNDKVNRKMEIGDDAFQNELNEERRKKAEEIEAQAKRKAEQAAALRAAQAAEPIKCPKCGSTQISANKKGVSVGKAVVGAAMVGGLGLLAGAHGSDKVIITCLKCGHQWKPGKK